MTNDTAVGVTVPGAPTGLGATAAGAAQINLSWTAPAATDGAPIAGYKIQVSTDGGSNYTDLEADTGTTGTTYAHTGLTDGTTYHYRVAAINSAGAGAYSAAASATTAGAVCAAPNLAGGRQIWTGTVTVGTSVSGGETVGYGFVARGNIGNLDNDDFMLGTDTYTIHSLSVNAQSSPVGALGLSLSGSLPPARAAGFKLHVCGEALAFDDAAYNASRHIYTWAAANLDWSGVRTRQIYLTVPTPGAPTGLGATAAGATQIDLSWTAPGVTGGTAISGYKIQVSTDGGRTYGDLAADTGSTATTYAHMGLTGGTTRHYRVAAINSAGTGVFSEAANATTVTVTVTVPGAPTGLGATAMGETQIDLSWTAPAATGGDRRRGHYRLQDPVLDQWRLHLYRPGGRHRQHRHHVCAYGHRGRDHLPLRGGRDQFGRHGRVCGFGQRHHRPRRADGPERDGVGRDADRPELDGANAGAGDVAAGRHRLQDRGLDRWRHQL